MNIIKNIVGALLFITTTIVICHATLDAAIYEIDSAPHLTDEQIFEECESVNYSTDACIEWKGSKQW